MAKSLRIEERRFEFLFGAKCIYKLATEYCGMKNESCEILAIDPARGNTGYAFRDSDDEIKTGNIVPGTKGFSKVIYVEKKLRKLLEDSFPFVAIEGYAMNAKWGRELAGELGGVIRRLLYFKKRPLLVISPLTIKAWIKAKKKEQIMLEILDRYKVKISNSDAADAFVLQEICHKSILMSSAVVGSGISEPEDIRIFLKNEDYKLRKGLENLYRYQENSLFNLISSQGRNIGFFLKNQ